MTIDERLRQVHSELLHIGYRLPSLAREIEAIRARVSGRADMVPPMAQSKITLVTGQELVIDAPADEVRSQLGAHGFTPLTKAQDPPETIYVAGSHVVSIEAE